MSGRSQVIADALWQSETPMQWKSQSFTDGTTNNQPLTDLCIMYNVSYVTYHVSFIMYHVSCIMHQPTTIYSDSLQQQDWWFTNMQLRATLWTKKHSSSYEEVFPFHPRRCYNNLYGWHFIHFEVLVLLLLKLELINGMWVELWFH